MPKNSNNSNYWQTLVSKLISISTIPPKNPTKGEKIANMITRHNPKTYDGKYGTMELVEWIREMEKIFTIIEILEEKKVNIVTFYLIRKDDIWWSTVKDRVVLPEFTWSKFLEELRAQFNLATIQW